MSTILATTAIDNLGGHARIFAYMTNTPTITVTTGGTFVPIAATYTNDPINDFSIVSNSIQYDHTVTQEFEVDWSANFSSGDAGRTIHIGTSKNGAVLTTASPSVMGIFAKYANEVVTLSGTFVIELATNDTLQLQVTSDTDLDEVTFEHFTTTIRPFSIGAS